MIMEDLLSPPDGDRQYARLGTIDFTPPKETACPVEECGWALTEATGSLNTIDDSRETALCES